MSPVSSVAAPVAVVTLIVSPVSSVAAPMAVVTLIVSPVVRRGGRVVLRRRHVAVAARMVMVVVVHRKLAREPARGVREVRGAVLVRVHGPSAVVGVRLVPPRGRDVVVVVALVVKEQVAVLRDEAVVHMPVVGVIDVKDFRKARRGIAAHGCVGDVHVLLPVRELVPHLHM